MIAVKINERSRRIDSVKTNCVEEIRLNWKLLKRMSESKKRPADVDGAAQFKKPKFEKKSVLKKNFEQQKANKPNPFQKTGTKSSTFL